MLKESGNTLSITEEQFESYVLYDRKLSTNKSALYALKNRFRVIKRHFTDKEFNRLNFTAFLQQERERGISEITLNKYISCAKHIAHLLELNFLDDYSYFKEHKKEIEYLTWDEMRALAEVQLPYRLSKEGITADEQNNRMWCYITLMAEVGCRKSEAHKLLWPDLKPYQVTFRETKNGDDRTVPITPLLFQRMQKLSRINERVFAVSELSSQMMFDLKKRAEVLGITKPIYNHVLRHSVASHLLKSKAPFKIVCNILGWKDPKTADRYDQTGISEMEELLSSYSRIFKQHLSYESLVDKVKAFVNSIVDKETAVLYISQSCDRLDIRITDATRTNCSDRINSR